MAKKDDNGSAPKVPKAAKAPRPPKEPKTPREPKAPKIKKAPGFYKKSLTEKQLEKKYLKFIGQPDDKRFIRSCYTAGDGALNIRRDLTDKDVKRLKQLKGAIGQNRKAAVKLVPLAAVAALAAALVVFFMFFANPLLRKALETGLEAVFEARVNAEDFRLNLFKFEVGMSGLTIADRDSPMKNLIAFGPMRAKLKPQAVLRGKVYIEEIRADHIRFGTDRTVSGALPDKPAKENPPKEKADIPPLVDLGNFDAAALLEREYGKLQTPKLYDSAVQAYDTALTKWKGEEEAAKARLEELRSRAEPLLKINVNDYRTVDAGTIERIRTTVAEVNALVATVQTVQDDVNRLVSGVQTDMNAALALEQSARNAFTADFDHLRSYLDLGSGSAMEVLEPVIMGLLTDSAGPYLAYGQRALEALEKVKALQAKLPRSAPRPPKAERLRGRDVIFPVSDYPGFYLGVLAADVLTPSDWRWDFDLRGVSSDPDISDTPTSLTLALAETGDGLNRSGAFKGRADFRSGADERFNAEVSGGGFPLALGAGLEQLGVDGFSGNASFTLNASGGIAGDFSGGGDISLIQAKLANPANTFARAADEAMRQLASVDLGIRYGRAVSGENNFSVTTNFGDILKNALGRVAGQYREQAEAALEEALRGKIEQYIDGKFVDKEDLDLVFQAVRSDKSAVDGLRNTLESKKNEFEGKIKSAAEDAAKQAVDEAKEQGKQAVEDILRGQTPSAPTLPNVPGLPGNLFRR